MYGHDFPNGYTIVPYKKGYVKSRHDETTHGDTQRITYPRVLEHAYSVRLTFK